MIVPAFPGPAAAFDVRAGLLIVFGLVSAYTDLRWRLIPNRVTGAAGLAALCAAGLAGWPGLASAGLGALAAGGLFLIPFVRGWIGGGDVKFFAVAGALAGIGAVLPMLLTCSLAAGLYGLALIAWVGARQRRFTARAHMPMAVPCGLALVGYGVAALLR